MNSLFKTISAGAIVVLLLASCSSNRDSDSNDPEQTLYQRVGGADGVDRLANQFATTVENNSELDDELDSSDIDDLKLGLRNDIMRASGMSPTSEESVSSALDDDGLDADELLALQSSLRQAAVLVGLDSGTISSLQAAVVLPAAAAADLD